jgi:hypothetical protein
VQLYAPDDRRGDAQNMLSHSYGSGFLFLRYSVGKTVGVDHSKLWIKAFKM